MKVTIELLYGPHGNDIVTASQLDDQVLLLKRLATGARPCAADAVKLIDTASILRSIQRALGGPEYP